MSIIIHLTSDLWLIFMTRLSYIPKFNFKLMLVHILIYTGQQKFDVNANGMITYRALKGEKRILYCNHAYDNRVLLRNL